MESASYGRRLRAVSEPRLFEPQCRSPRLPLWPSRDGEWLKVLSLPAYAPRRRRPVVAYHYPLFPEESKRQADA